MSEVRTDPVMVAQLDAEDNLAQIYEGMIGTPELDERLNTTAEMLDLLDKTYRVEAHGVTYAKMLFIADFEQSQPAPVKFVHFPKFDFEAKFIGYVQPVTDFVPQWQKYGSLCLWFYGDIHTVPDRKLLSKHTNIFSPILGIEKIEKINS